MSFQLPIACRNITDLYPVLAASKPATLGVFKTSCTRDTGPQGVFDFH